MDRPRQETPGDHRRWAWTADPKTPFNPIDAIMRTAPGQAIDESAEELQILREAVAQCAAALTLEHQYLLNGIDAERLSFRQLGPRIGMSKTHAHRLHKQALTAIAPLLRAHPTIYRRYKLDTETWNEAAEDAAAWIMVIAEEAPSPTSQLIAEGKQVLGTANEDELPLILQDIGANAFRFLNTFESRDDLRKTIVNLLVERHHKYGAGNILEFEQVGLLVRMSDKHARILHGKNDWEAGKADFDDDPYLDAYLDLVGYACISTMLERDTFLLPLKETK